MFLLARGCFDSPGCALPPPPSGGQEAMHGVRRHSLPVEVLFALASRAHANNTTMHARDCLHARDSVRARA